MTACGNNLLYTYSATPHNSKTVMLVKGKKTLKEDLTHFWGATHNNCEVADKIKFTLMYASWTKHDHWWSVSKQSMAMCFSNLLF